jgi:chromosome segregation ATPase
MTDVQKLTLEYQEKITQITQYLFGLGVSNIAANRSVVRQLELKLKGASKEELSELARQELLNVVKQLKAQEDIMEKQSKLSSKVHDHDKRIKEQEKKGFDLGDRIDEAEDSIKRNDTKHSEHEARQDQKLKKHDELLAKHERKDVEHDDLLDKGKKKDEDQDRRLAEQVEKDSEHDRKLAEQVAKDEEHDRLLEEGKKRDLEQDKIIGTLRDQINELENKLESVEQDKFNKKWGYISLFVGIVGLILSVIQFVL